MRRRLLYLLVLLGNSWACFRVLKEHGYEADWMPLQYNADGSLDVYIQKDAPGKEREANWLPAPAGPFSVTMRVYWPRPEMLDGSWKPPGIRRID